MAAIVKLKIWDLMMIMTFDCCRGGTPHPRDSKGGPDPDIQPPPPTWGQVWGDQHWQAQSIQHSTDNRERSSSLAITTIYILQSP